MANETRRRYLAIDGVIDNNPLAIGDTTLNSANLAGLPAVGSGEHVAIVLDPDAVYPVLPEIVHVTAHTALATPATIARGKEGTTAREHLQGVKWAHAATPLDFRTRQWRKGKRTSGSYTTTASWAAVGTDFDLVLEAAAGDLIVVSAAAIVDIATSQFVTFDAASIVSGSPVNWLSGNGGAQLTNGFLGWFCVGSGGLAGLSGGGCFLVQAGDLVTANGVSTVTLRMFGKSSSVSGIIRATAADPLNWMAQNIGPTDPA